MQRKGGDTGKGLVRALARAGSRSDRSPAVARKGPPVRERTVCVDCGAVFTGKTWRRSARRLRTAAEIGGSTLEVLTTSQKLAHRLAREIVKAFRGSVSYHWSDGDGRLLAVWRRDEARRES